MPVIPNPEAQERGQGPDVRAHARACIPLDSFARISNGGYMFRALNASTSPLALEAMSGIST